ncbi:uncharacterized protein B0I36DRAFT_288087 [Microdochium trichocladiopsis]|uniref:Amidohydrolase-related domain-containing protein n=1 Tax=Microdochium trichocladiopsis TaxID=1682393 RepID=A0A9P9BMU0_9PEZI|nr:uncharacterized protein B0I36DRAFT_288087 [Microdochium trichocladiopsis]KAH7030571.1 hypothetical protein B0I36DRAFT_288087 [Microdochium trichocladiopsis]
MASITSLLPSSSWDVHVHVFDPVKHPYIPRTRYTPPARSVGDLLRETHTHNYVIVMSGPEGTNTSHTEEAMAELQAKGHNACGVVVMDTEQMTPTELQRLDRAGVRSVRFNTQRTGTSLEALLEQTAGKIAAAGLGWSIEAAIFEVALWQSLIPTMRKLHRQFGTVFVADHIFAAQPEELGSTALSQVLDLVDEGVVVVKISGLTKYNRNPEAMMPIVKEILKKGDGRGGVFASDWPHVFSHPGATDLMEVDIPAHLTLLKAVCDEIGNGAWEKLMRDNAVALYAMN